MLSSDNSATAYLLHHGSVTYSSVARLSRIGGAVAKASLNRAILVAGGRPEAK
jgi:hypothetical protein